MPGDRPRLRRPRLRHGRRPVRPGRPRGPARGLREAAPARRGGRAHRRRRALRGVRGDRQRGQGPAGRPPERDQRGGRAEPPDHRRPGPAQGRPGRAGRRDDDRGRRRRDRALAGRALHHTVEGRPGPQGARQVAGHRPRGRQAVPAGALPRGRGRGDDQAGGRAARRRGLRRGAALRLRARQ
ncbi:16S rRNA (Uracil(1498)-N(3))-methyltransferase [Streptomyces misionensis JCM 4497]